MVVHSAGVEVMISVTLSLLVCVLFFSSMKFRQEKGWVRLAAFFFGGILAIFISAAKLNAALHFMAYFPREVTAPSSPSYLAGLLGICGQLLGYPFFSLLGMSAEQVRQLLFSLNGNNWGLWEHDVFLPTPLFVILALCLIGLLGTREGRKDLGKWMKSRKVPVFAGLLMLWVLIDLIVSRGLFYSVLRTLPVFKSLHVNIRFTSALIVPLCISGALCYENLKVRFVKNRIVDVFADGFGRGCVRVSLHRI